MIGPVNFFSISGAGITVIPTSGRILDMVVDGRFNFVEEITDQYGVIKALEFLETDRISVGESLKISIFDSVNSYYYIHSIKKENHKHYIIECEPFNMFSWFLVPLINENISKIGYKTWFVNCYLVNNKYIGLKYRTSDSKRYSEIEKTLKSFNTFVYSIVLNKEFDLYLFKIDETLLDYVELVKKGKYSKIPEDLKEKIIKRLKLDNNHQVYRAFYAYKTLKEEYEKILDVKLKDDIELLSIPSENEYLNLNLQNYVKRGIQ